MKKILLWIVAALLYATDAFPQTTLSPWREGYLDIHFISTGCGNCMFCIFPDGTTMLIDAGELDPSSPQINSARITRRFPNYTKYAYQWQADYISEILPRNKTIDYALVTHYHEDHYGGLYPGIIPSKTGGYSLTGIIGVGSIIPINTLVDRGTDYPYDFKKAIAKYPERFGTFSNYQKFVEFQSQRKDFKYESFAIGNNKQFVMKNTPEKYPDFRIENISANGKAWNGKTVVSKMPPAVDYPVKEVMPDENQLSCGFLLRYGNFEFFTNGDIPGQAPQWEQKPEWHDVESVVAPCVGEVDVTTTNHHANRDAMSAYYLGVLKPRVIIQEVWSADHPGHDALLRMTSRKIWPDDRDLFATAMLDANRLVIGDMLDSSYKSTQGHIVVRVLPGGNEYMIYVLDNTHTSKYVTGTFGPYLSKKKQ